MVEHAYNLSPWGNDAGGWVAVSLKVAWVCSEFKASGGHIAKLF